MPRKPSKPFGRIAFSKSGGVRQEITQLPHVKETQELEAATRFVSAFNEISCDRTITDLRQLGEKDHDFFALISGVPLEIQLTELVDRSYTFDMTIEEYNAGTWKQAVQEMYGALPRRVDLTLRDEALSSVILNKLGKSYSKPSQGELRLVAFTTTNYLTEYIEAGVLKTSEGLRRARVALQGSSSEPFNEVWFTNLQTRPVQVWPIPT